MARANGLLGFLNGRTNGQVGEKDKVKHGNKEKDE
jgi:hypothetical protein